MGGITYLSRIDVSATDACSRGSRSSPRSTGMSRGCGQIVVEFGPAETVRAWTGKS